MSRSAVVVALAAASLVAGGLVTSAQVIDATPCEQACYEQEASCVSACDTHVNPVECEDRCHDERDDCLGRCG